MWYTKLPAANFELHCAYLKKKVTSESIVPFTEKKVTSESIVPFREERNE